MRILLGGSCYEDLVYEDLVMRILVGGSCCEDLGWRILVCRILLVRILL